MRLLLIDNYDSFTWNLAQYLEELGAEVEVQLNDALSVEECLERNADGWIISPGPGRPEESGVTLDAVRLAAGRIPLLGVCLGHQAIAQADGASIVQAPKLMHGKTSQIYHDGEGLFEGLEQPFEATRYHSLVVDRATLSQRFVVTAQTEPMGQQSSVVMAIRHISFPLWGVQFHPESILTLSGKALLANFLRMTRRYRLACPPTANGGK